MTSRGKVTRELLSFTYGALVVKLIKDLEQAEDVNTQLKNMGKNIGMRMIDEFLAKSNINRCSDLRETADTIAKAGFKMFLGVQAEVGAWGDNEFSIFVTENPLTEFVEVPEQYSDLVYANIIAGVLVGVMEMIHIRADAWFVRDSLRGDDVTEIRVKVIEYIQAQYKEDDP